MRPRRAPSSSCSSGGWYRHCCTATPVRGIYALERIAVDSKRDHPTVVEVLSAFMREHSSTAHRWRGSGGRLAGAGTTLFMTG
jgi:hypothetical protein